MSKKKARATRAGSGGRAGGAREEPRESRTARGTPEKPPRASDLRAAKTRGRRFGQTIAREFARTVASVRHPAEGQALLTGLFEEFVRMMDGDAATLSRGVKAMAKGNPQMMAMFEEIAAGMHRTSLARIRAVH